MLALSQYLPALRVLQPLPSRHAGRLAEGVNACPAAGGTAFLARLRAIGWRQHGALISLAGAALGSVPFERALVCARALAIASDELSTLIATTSTTVSHTALPLLTRSAQPTLLLLLLGHLNASLAHLARMPSTAAIRRALLLMPRGVALSTRVLRSLTPFGASQEGTSALPIFLVPACTNFALRAQIGEWSYWPVPQQVDMWILLSVQLAGRPRLSVPQRAQAAPPCVQRFGYCWRMLSKAAAVQAVHCHRVRCRRRRPCPNVRC